MAYLSELVGDFKNAGREWRPQGSPEEVRVHDFVIPEFGRAVPYGVYDIADSAGWVSDRIDHDTASFAANAIRNWWTLMGRERYANPRSLLMTADGGGSDGSRVRLWKLELQKLADEIGVPITVCHLPPGTSKASDGQARRLLRADQTGRCSARRMALLIRQLPEADDRSERGVAGGHHQDRGCRSHLRGCTWSGEPPL